MVVQASPVTSSTVVVAVDVGSTEFAFSLTDVARTLLTGHVVGSERGSNRLQVEFTARVNFTVHAQAPHGGGPMTERAEQVPRLRGPAVLLTTALRCVILDFGISHVHPPS